MQQHTTTVTHDDLFDDWSVSCSCSWSQSGHDTRLHALGAGDVHVARSIG